MAETVGVSEPFVQTRAESPFLDTYTPEPAIVQPVSLRVASPFLSEFPSDSEEYAYEPNTELYRELLSELEDDEMDEALYELVDEASNLADRYASRSASEAQDARLERMLQEHFAPLASAAEDMIERAAARAETVDLTAARDSEIDEVFEHLEPETPLGSPAFEQFFGALKKKLKKAASKAAGLVKKGVSLATGPLLKAALAKLKGLVRPLLQKVLKIALDKIPSQYRPVAVQVAQRLGIKLPGQAAPNPGDESADGTSKGTQEPTPSADPTTPDPGEVQQELDWRMTEALLSSDAMELETFETTPASDPLADLDRARGQFVREVLDARDASDAAPIVERFLPAVMTALRLGIKLIGRPKVVAFLGNLIGKFISPFVGAKGAPALGRVVADLGLKTFLQAELSEADERTLAAEGLASIVEETVRRVASIPPELLEEPSLGEALMYESFQSAAAATFPAELMQPALREAESGGWVLLPIAGRKHYRKFARVFDVTLSPQAAAGIVTFGGGSLGDFLRDRLRIPPGPVSGRVHLYEAIPHTRLSRIARSEGVRGLGSADEGAWSQLHPLTQEAAAVLTGAPRLGRPFGEEADRRHPMVGERYYFLEVPSAPARPVGRESQLKVTVDFPKDEIRVSMYLSEVIAQRIASLLRKQAQPAEVIAALRSAFGGARPAEAGQGPGRRMRVILGRASALGTRTMAGVLSRVAVRALRKRLRSHVLDWTWANLSDLFAKRAEEFIKKTDGPEDGVRLAIAFHAPVGLAALRGAFLGRPPAAADWLPTRAPSARIEIEPGVKT